MPDHPKPTAPRRSPSMWFGVATGILLLVVLLVFILQNLQEVKVSFFWVNWRVPLAVDLLFATVLGALIVFAAGSVRILQLRRTARRGGDRRPADPHPTDPSAGEHPRGEPRRENG